MRTGTRRRAGARVTTMMAATFAVAVVLMGAGANAADAKPKTKVTTVKVATVPGVGKVLVDAQGKTLYTLTNNGTAVACTGQCPQFWPPLVVTAGAKATGPKTVKHLAVQTGTDQVTQNGLPLYRFMGDATSGVANGEGINAFGGTWHVVMVSGTSAPAKTKTSSSTNSGY